MSAKRLVTILTVLVVSLSACGVSEEDFLAAQQEAKAAKEMVGELETDLAETREELDSTVEDLVTAEDRATASANDADAVRTDLATAQSDLSNAQESINDLQTLQAGRNFNGSVLFSVLAAQQLRCGINGSLVGFSEMLPGGRVIGFEADYCRAIAAAVLGDADAVVFVPLTAAERFTAVQAGQVDVLIRNTTHTLGRSSGLLLDFGPTIFYDGQQLMGRSSDLEDGVEAVDGMRLCVLTGTRMESNALEFAESIGATLHVVGTSNFDQGLDRLAAGLCDLVTTDGSGLASNRAKAVEAGRFEHGELMILPALMSKEPLAPAILQGDTFWRDVVDWVVYSTFIAEERGVTSTNIDAVEWDSTLRVLFGEESDQVFNLGLPVDGLYQAIKQVGNYGEIYDRHLAELLPREGTSNLPWYEGGLLYGPRV